MAETTPGVSTPTLNALLAAIGELNSSQRAPTLRALLENGLDLMQAHELEYYTFVGECALLAADNMQDIRIENLELRVAAIENPPAKPWGEALTEIALNLALQVVIVAAWWGAAEAVIAVAGVKAMADASAAAAAELAATRSQQQQITAKLTGLIAERNKLLSLERQIADSGHAVAEMANPYETADDLPYLRSRLSIVRTEFKLAVGAGVKNQAGLTRALDTFEKASADGSLADLKLHKQWSGIWSEFIGNEKGGVVITTTTDVLDHIQDASKGAQVDNTGSSGAPGKDASEPFVSSTLTGRYLAWTADQRLDVVERYGDMRLMLRATSDSDLLAGDDFIKYVAALMTEVLPRWQDLRRIPQGARPAIVKGFEAAFWHEYLSAAGVLADPQRVSYSAIRAQTQGTVAGPFLILSNGKETTSGTRTTSPQGLPAQPDGGDITTYVHDAEFYSGARKINDLLAAALYKRFAEPRFTHNKDAASSLLPFVFDPSKYVGVAIPPKDDVWGYPDPKAVQSIDEMRILVIEFFLNLRADGIDPAKIQPFASLTFMSAVTGAEARGNFESWLKAQAQGVDQGSGDPVAKSQTATAAAERQFKDLAARAMAAPDTPLALQIAQLQFADMLTDLNQDIQAYQLRKSGALEIDSKVDPRTDTDLEHEIDTEKDLLQAAYQQLLTQAASDPTAKQKLIDLYQKPVDAAVQWQPTMNWVWYGPDYETSK